MGKKLFVIFWFLVQLLLGIAQENIEKTFASLQEITSEIAARTDATDSYEELADRLFNLANNPIKINTANNEELDKLFWMNEFQIIEIQKYIATNGQFKTIFELSYVPGISETEAKLLAPFISFDFSDEPTKIKLNELITNGKHRLLLRTQRILETQKGFETPDTLTESNHFTGNPMKYYIRYNYEVDKRVSLGFTGEKDAGEQFFGGSNKRSFDFQSAYLQVNNVKFIKSFVVGDYRLNFGQGLAVWTGFSFGKSSSVMSSMQRNTGINHYQSADENNFFRGTAITLQFKPFDVSVFYSRNSIDANITRIDSANGKVMEVSSLQTTGIHGVPSEINDEDAVNAEVMGFNISLLKPKIHTGFTALYHQYSAYLNSEIQPYNQFNFRGKSNFNLSFDYKYRTGNLIFFGEEATSQNGAFALLNGIQSHINSRLNISIISRYYQRNYQAMFGNSFGENTTNSNESGVFAGFELRPFKYISFSGYMDIFRFPCLKYGVDMPSDGREFLAQITVSPTDKFQMYLQYRNKSKDENYSAETDSKNQIVNATSNRIRYNLAYSVSNNIQLHCRMEWTKYKNDVSNNSTGFYVAEDIEFSLPKIPVKVYLRYALFDANDYNARIYAYESDLLYSFSIPAFSDKGSRTYAMVKYAFGKHIDVWLKYGITQYANKETISSGLYENAGNKRSEVKMQVLLKF